MNEARKSPLKPEQEVGLGLRCPCGNRLTSDAVEWFVVSTTIDPSTKEINQGMMTYRTCSLDCEMAENLGEKAIARRALTEITWLVDEPGS